MKITYDDIFTQRLKTQIDYIANDKPIAAKNLKRKILAQIKEIPKFPYSFRKSIFFENDNIRDLIVLGYTIVFEISENEIYIFGFRKNQNDVL
jgi:plasmid stabilization system protein ParE